MVHAYVHRTIGFGENELSVQNQFSTVFVWNTVSCTLSSSTHTHTRSNMPPPIHLVSFLIGSEADKIAVSEEEEDEHVEEVEEVEVT